MKQKKIRKGHLRTGHDSGLWIETHPKIALTEDMLWKHQNPIIILPNMGGSAINWI